MKKDVLERLDENTTEWGATCVLIKDAADEIRVLRYRLQLDEELIDSIKKIITVLNNRPDL